MLLHVGSDILPKYHLVYRVYLPFIVWVWVLRSGECNVCHSLHFLLDVVSHLIFPPDEVDNLFGGSHELIGSLPWIHFRRG